MLMDVQALFSDKQNLANAAGTYNSTNVIDLGAPGTDVMGNVVAHDVGLSATNLEARLSQACASAGAATLQVLVVNADTPDLATNPTVVARSEVIPLAALVQGYRFQLARVPPGTKQRYLGLQYVIGTAALTAGQVMAGIVVTPTP